MNHKTAEKIIMFFIGFLAIAAVGKILCLRTDPPAIRVSDSEHYSAKEITVAVSGEVKNSGTYKVAAGTSLHELLYLAGGIKDDADPESVDPDSILYEDCSINVGKLSDYELKAKKALQKPNVNNKCNINTASATELAMLDKIGEKTAEDIVRYRQEHGSFQAIEDIKKVKGIGEKTFASIKDFITVE